MERSKLVNLPNGISSSRLLLAVVFILTGGIWQRVALILAAGVTDVLDGWLARRARNLNVIGALLDPIADRLFVLAAISAYLAEGLITPGQFFIFLSRDIATVVGFIVSRFIPGLSAAAFKARPLGKAVTILQLAMLVAVLIAPGAVQGLVWGIALVATLSIVDYTAALERARRAARSGAPIAILVIALATVVAPLASAAQGPSVEVRTDAIFARDPALHAGAGLVFPTGRYLRTGLIAAGGYSRNGPGGRTEVVNRFHLDPFRESRWAPYAGGGISARFDSGEPARGYLLVVVGVDGPLTRGMSPSIEAGLGGGGRIGLTLRRGSAERR